MTDQTSTTNLPQTEVPEAPETESPDAPGTEGPPSGGGSPSPPPKTRTNFAETLLYVNVDVKTKK